MFITGPWETEKVQDLDAALVDGIFSSVTVFAFDDFLDFRVLLSGSLDWVVLDFPPSDEFRDFFDAPGPCLNLFGDCRFLFWGFIAFLIKDVFDFHGLKYFKICPNGMYVLQTRLKYGPMGNIRKDGTSTDK